MVVILEGSALVLFLVSDIRSRAETFVFCFLVGGEFEQSLTNRDFLFDQGRGRRSNKCVFMGPHLFDLKHGDSSESKFNSLLKKNESRRIKTHENTFSNKTKENSKLNRPFIIITHIHTHFNQVTRRRGSTH